MTLPISTNNTTAVFLGRHSLKDDTIETIRKIAKEEAERALKNTSEQVKILLKEEADECSQNTAPIITGPIKAIVSQSSPEKLIPVINESIDTYVENVSKKTSNYLIDKYVDSSAKKMIDVSVDSTISIVSRVYNYVRNRFF